MSLNDVVPHPRLPSVEWPTVALIACSGYIAFDPTPRIYGHRATAARLWMLCEKYRALLAEVHDELIDMNALKERRAELLRDATSVLENTSPDDRASYEIARKALKGLGGAGYSDADLDRYLPASLRKQQTTAESRLWAKLRNRQMAGRKFRRQVPLCGFVVDFTAKVPSLTSSL